MAHLATVQNLLRFIGGPLNFEREDFPFRNFLYPFKFTLEPLSRKAIAKYICAEMPSEPGNQDLIFEIIQEAQDEEGGTQMNRVGELYEKLISIFEDQKKLPDINLLSHTATGLQAGPEDWNIENDPCLLVKKISSRVEAIGALKSIAEQGEGLRKPRKNEPCPQSHFDMFLQMYREYTGINKRTPSIPILPTRHVPTNPSTFPEPFSDKNLEKNRITNTLALLLAHLFNVKYRMLIMYLSHTFTIEESKGNRGLKKIICSMTLTEMRFLNEIAIALLGLPLKEQSVDSDKNLDLAAAPPFELPPSLVFPDREGDQWQLHSSLNSSAIELVKKIRIESGDPGLFKFFVNQETKYYEKLVELLPDVNTIKITLNELMRIQHPS
jgi:hypothetical protein